MMDFEDRAGNLGQDSLLVRAANLFFPISKSYPEPLHLKMPVKFATRLAVETIAVSF